VYIPRVYAVGVVKRTIRGTPAAQRTVKHPELLIAAAAEAAGVTALHLRRGLRPPLRGDRPAGALARTEGQPEMTADGRTIMIGNITEEEAGGSSPPSPITGPTSRAGTPLTRVEERLA
jgi:hypothetical protein